MREKELPSFNGSMEDPLHRWRGNLSELDLNSQSKTVTTLVGGFCVIALCWRVNPNTSWRLPINFNFLSLYKCTVMYDRTVQWNMYIHEHVRSRVLCWTYANICNWVLPVLIFGNYIPLVFHLKATFRMASWCFMCFTKIIHHLLRKKGAIIGIQVQNQVTSGNKSCKRSLYHNTIYIQIPNSKMKRCNRHRYKYFL